jgi:hypothetical protein
VDGCATNFGRSMSSPLLLFEVVRYRSLWSRRLRSSSSVVGRRAGVVCLREHSIYK